MMYENKHFYFNPDCNFANMAKEGKFEELINAVKNVAVNIEEHYGAYITATNQTEYLLVELARQGKFEVLKEIAVILEKLFTEVEDYNSLLVLSKYIHLTAMKTT